MAGSITSANSPNGSKIEIKTIIFFIINFNCYLAYYPATTIVGNYVTGVSGTGTTATLTMNNYPGLAVGDTVTIAGVTPTGYNASGVTVTAVSSASPWTFSYANTTTGSTGFVSGVGTVSTTGLTLNTKSLSLNGVPFTTDGSTVAVLGNKDGMNLYLGTPSNVADFFLTTSGGGTNVVVTVNAGLGASGQEIGAEIAEYLRQYATVSGVSFSNGS